ncbi:MAG TPA: methyltransferase [Gammaproteobacteria bacterium]
MLNAQFFGRIRVKVAQVTFFLLFLYCFIIAPIAIDPLCETKGLIGATVMILGALIRSLSAGYISKNDFLASEGLYALTRNPLYFGSFTALLGLNIVIWDLLFAVVTATLFAITYIPTILKEEAGLAHAFPVQWPLFKKSTPRFFPAFWRLYAYKQIHWSYALWKRNREYRGFATVLLLIAALAWYSTRVTQ